LDGCIWVPLWSQAVQHYHIGVTGAIKTNKERRLFSTANTSSNVWKDNIKKTVTAEESGCAALNWQVL